MNTFEIFRQHVSTGECYRLQDELQIREKIMDEDQNGGYNPTATVLIDHRQEFVNLTGRLFGNPYKGTHWVMNEEGKIVGTLESL